MKGMPKNMERTYAYESKRYQFKIVFVGYLLIAIAVVLSILFIMKPTQYLYLIGVGVAIYGILNTFVLKSNPRDVVINDDTISFVSFGEATYNIDKIKTFMVKEFANAQFYIRVEDKQGKRGRYWVQYYYFSDREELINELYCIEKKVHPTILKFRGRENMFNVRPCNEIKLDETEIDPFFKS
ncbi:MAG: hypothetical protein ACOWWR_18145 [Eubacteriales bacterium]